MARDEAIRASAGGARAGRDEGPSEEDLGWLADLRGTRDAREPLGEDAPEPTGQTRRRPEAAAGPGGRPDPGSRPDRGHPRT